MLLPLHHFERLRLSLQTSVELLITEDNEVGPVVVEDTVPIPQLVLLDLGPAVVVGKEVGTTFFQSSHSPLYSVFAWS